MPSNYITKSQRKILIESYLECQDDVFDGPDDMGIDDHTQESLNALNNSDLIKTCVAFMPDCMDEI